MKWHIPYAGETYVFDDARLTASEARLQKRITDGMSPSAADRARYELDPDAWVSALVIARRRIGLEVADALDVDVDEIDLMVCMEATSVAGRADLAAAKAETTAKPRARSRKQAAAAAEPEVVDAEPAPAT